ncbi:MULTISPECIES: SDR family oxidoreductase [unclassified Methylophilus]|uniref:SDR family oxidoreductase n=1 Tax=unclassified Methylophilus TaxID=2630143 RepID=UPI00188F5227|nr:SDR family oxidoreductase [Methylophilus sp. 13]MBF5040597.1 SDR family oxidoreductase [Methylophilus sp. 13]
MYFMAKTNSDCLHIVITGASSGLGAAMATAYAQHYRQQLQLSLCGRNTGALQALASQLSSQYQVACTTYSVDVRQADQMQAMAQAAIQQYGTPHIVIGNAGVSRGTLTEYQDDIPAFQAVFDTNVMGLVHTFQPFIEAMKQATEQGKMAQLVGIASVAGIRGLPGAGAYSASKAAAITYLESLRVEMQQYAITVTTIAPGYIRTPMTDINTYPMPFLMDADVFARKAMRVIAQQRRFSVIPWQMGIVARLLRLIPPGLWDWIMKKAPHKARLPD